MPDPPAALVYETFLTLCGFMVSVFVLFPRSLRSALAFYDWLTNQMRLARERFKAPVPPCAPPVYFVYVIKSHRFLSFFCLSTVACRSPTRPAEAGAEQAA